MRVLLPLLIVGLLAGCACRPGHVGPYGGVHPARCWVW
jgi:hypothetical protein